MSEIHLDAHHSAAAAPEHVAAPIDTDAALEALRHGPRGALFIAAISVSLLLVSWLPSISSCSCREVPLADTHPDFLQRPLLDSVVPAEQVARTEKRWLSVMVGMLILMMAIVVLTGVTNAIHPPSNVETIDPTTLHLDGEFAESNLGTAQELDGSLTARLIGEQYAFVPECVKVAVDTPVKFRLTSTDVVHGFLITGTNINLMLVPGYVSSLRARFETPGERLMPCHEFCGMGHEGMWGRIKVVDKVAFTRLAADRRRLSCVE